MALTLNQLIQLANLSEDVKKDALANLDKMNEEQKLRLSQICWENIASSCENEMKSEYEKTLEEMAEGQEHSPEDFKLIEEKVITSLLAKIEGLETQQAVTDVKEEIQQHLNPSP
ncbi:hypothetical protein HY439_02865 [Candidatus Microgenomates bacterium]|nr:hypothetical protein [Candidatus Microgenomates bacterium]